MKLLSSILFIFIISCSNSEQQNDKASESFKPPLIVQMSHSDSIENWNTEKINEIFPILIGQYKFSDTIKLYDERQARNIDENQYRWEQNICDFDTLSTDGLQIWIWKV